MQDRVEAFLHKPPTHPLDGRPARLQCRSDLIIRLRHTACRLIRRQKNLGMLEPPHIGFAFGQQLPQLFDFQGL